mgnify:CR=1 FL=1
MLIDLVTLFASIPSISAIVLIDISFSSFLIINPIAFSSFTQGFVDVGNNFGKRHSPRSPILGIVRPVRLDLIRPSDVIKMFDGIDEVVFFRDPWILQFYASDGSDGNVSEAVKAAMLNVRGLVGEAFLEEDRGLTETYEGILRALALGNVFPKDIASFLGKHSSEIKSFLRNLMDMGIVKRVKVYGKKRWVYKISSPIIDLFYYLDTKYGISDLSIESEVFEKVYTFKLPRYFEDFVRAALAEKYGGNEELMLSPEVDVLITLGNRIVCCAEVKVKADNGDLKKLELKTARFDCEKVVVDGTNFKKILFQE